MMDILMLYFMKGFIIGDTPCNVNTEYESVVIMGKAALVKDYDLKEMVLNKIVEKYTPHFNGTKIPDSKIKGTGIIEVIIKELTGKYYK